MNNVAYFEIQASEPERAILFYADVFGWQFVRQEEMPIDYWQIVSDGINGGLLARPAPAPQTGMGTNAFVCSLQVEDFDKTAADIMQYGGAVALLKFAVPGKCWQGYFLDTDHNTFGLFQVDPDAR
jgi:predicted enzyme related to lactoylglutathione lyase